MSEEPVKSKLLGDYVLARTIANLTIILSVYGLCYLFLGYDVGSNFWSFMAVVVGGSFLGNAVGASIGKKLDRK